MKVIQEGHTSQQDVLFRMAEAFDFSDLAEELIENNQRWVVVWYQSRFDGVEDVIAPLTERDYQEVFAVAKRAAGYR